MIVFVIFDTGVVGSHEEIAIVLDKIVSARESTSTKAKTVITLTSNEDVYVNHPFEYVLKILRSRIKND